MLGRVKPKLRLLAEKQGGVFARHQTLSCGYTPDEIQARLDSGRWERVRHGQYAVPLDLSRLQPWERQRIRHRRLVHAVVNSMRPGSVAVSHQSALVLHGAPIWGMDLDEVQLNRLDNRRGGPIAGVRHHRGLLTPADLTEVDGVTATTVARAVVETACSASFEAAVVSADAMWREYPASRSEIDRLLDVIECWPGSASAREALAFGDPRSESVGESRLRVLMYVQGLPTPVLQVVFEDADGFVARVDFYFPEFDTVVEFDGLLKYGDGTSETLIREKSREDRLRALGLQVVRVTWVDLDRPESTANRIRQAFHRSRRAA